MNEKLRRGLKQLPDDEYPHNNQSKTRGHSRGGIGKDARARGDARGCNELNISGQSRSEENKIE